MLAEIGSSHVPHPRVLSDIDKAILDSFENKLRLLNRYNWDNIAADLQTIYRKIMNKKRLTIWDMINSMWKQGFVFFGEFALLIGKFFHIIYPASHFCNNKLYFYNTLLLCLIHTILNISEVWVFIYCSYDEQYKSTQYAAQLCYCCKCVILSSNPSIFSMSSNTSNVQHTSTSNSCFSVFLLNRLRILE